MRLKYFSDKEQAALCTVKEVLAKNQNLRLRLAEYEIDPNSLFDGKNANYVGDYLAHKLGDRVVQHDAVLNEMHEWLTQHTACHAHIIGTIQDFWRRYPLDAFLRLVWRNRKSPSQLHFLKGAWQGSKFPDMWHLQIRNQGSSTELICSSFADNSYIQMLLTGPYAPRFQDFRRHMREFLDIPCDTVWLSDITNIRMEGLY